MKCSSLKITTLLAAALFTAGCASIVKGRHQEVSFQSTPDGATVTINGRTIGKTPISITLQKKTDQTVIFEKSGYKPFTFALETRTSGWFWGNIVLGGLIGSTTDGVTGAATEYSPSQYMITLQPISENSISANPNKSREDRIKEFILISYINIRSDLNAGKGVYLSSLLSLINAKPAEHTKATDALKLLAENTPNILDFSEEVVRMFPPKPED